MVYAAFHATGPPIFVFLRVEGGTCGISCFMTFTIERCSLQGRDL